MALKGINARIKVSTTAGGAGTYTDVAEMNQGNITVGGENIDISYFGTSAWATRIQGRKDVSLSGSGFLVPGDTSGQNAIRDALINDTELWAQFLWNGTNGFKAQFRVASFAVDAGAGPTDVVGLSISLEGTSAATVI